MNIVLLSGGSGQRLWPLSNEIRSKQFIKIFHKEDGELESMVQRVYRQIRTVDTDATVTIATSKSQVSAIHNQLGENVGISVEPCRRDTFPAIALAAAYLKDVQHIGEAQLVHIKVPGRFVTTTSASDFFASSAAFFSALAIENENFSAFLSFSETMYSPAGQLSLSQMKSESYRTALAASAQKSLSTHHCIRVSSSNVKYP